MEISLIELYKNCKATAVIIEEKYLNIFDNPLILDASELSSGDKALYKNLEIKSKLSSIAYLIIKNVDKNINVHRLIGLVKDRIINNQTLPENVIIIFTIRNKNELKNINKDLYALCSFVE